MAHEVVEILLVENNPNDLELILHALRKFYLANHIEVARDGTEALDYLFAAGAFAGRSTLNMPSLILLDLRLPRVDGLEVLQKIKSSPETQAIPVVVLTSSREERDIVESYRLGVNSYISKPVDFEQFTEVVRQIGLYWLVLKHRLSE
jgi:two-component system, response regulator